MHLKSDLIELKRNNRDEWRDRATAIEKSRPPYWHSAFRCVIDEYDDSSVDDDFANALLDGTLLSFLSIPISGFISILFTPR